MADNIVITPGAGAGGSEIEIQQNGSVVVSAASTVNFTGNSVSVTDAGGGVVNVEVSATSSVNNLLYRHNGSTTQTVNSTFGTIVFPTSVKQDSDYSYSGGDITFQRTGTYKVQYDISIDKDSSNARTNGETAAFLNGVEINGTKVWTYHRNAANGEDTGTALFILDVNLNDQLSIRSRYGNGDTLTTLANSCRIFIERIS